MYTFTTVTPYSVWHCNNLYIAYNFGKIENFWTQYCKMGYALTTYALTTRSFNLVHSSWKLYQNIYTKRGMFSWKNLPLLWFYQHFQQWSPFLPHMAQRCRIPQTWGYPCILVHQGILRLFHFAVGIGKISYTQLITYTFLKVTMKFHIINNFNILDSHHQSSCDQAVRFSTLK